MAEIVAKVPAGDLTESERLCAGRRRARTAIALIQVGELQEALRAFQDSSDPEALTQFVHQSRERGLQPAELVTALDVRVERPRAFHISACTRRVPARRVCTIGALALEGPLARLVLPRPEPRNTWCLRLAASHLGSGTRGRPPWTAHPSHMTRVAVDRGSWMRSVTID